MRINKGRRRHKGKESHIWQAAIMVNKPEMNSKRLKFDQIVQQLIQANALSIEIIWIGAKGRRQNFKPKFLSILPISN